MMHELTGVEQRSTSIFHDQMDWWIDRTGQLKMPYWKSLTKIQHNGPTSTRAFLCCVRDEPNRIATLTNRDGSTLKTKYNRSELKLYVVLSAEKPANTSETREQDISEN